MWSYLIIGITYAFAAAVQPGPLQTYLVSETIRRGWRRTLPAALAPLLSDAPIVAISLVLLSEIPSRMIRLLHFAGAVFLFYLAFAAWRAWRRYHPHDACRSNRSHGTLMRAAFVNLLNPNPWLGWCLVMGPILLEGWRKTHAHGVALIVGFYGTMVLCLTGFIILFALAGNLGPQFNRVTLGLSVLALAGFAFYQLWLGVVLA
jgi:threonine/homoserine/homoserine lactone efflux protein